jgi:oligoendopeptidase F
VRERAATSISGVLDKNIRLFSRITNTLVKDKAIEDGWRHFARPISGATSPTRSRTRWWTR